MKKIALFSETASPTYEARRLIEEGIKRGVEVVHMRYSDISISFSPETKLLHRNKSIIDEYDYFILRSAKAASGTSYSHYVRVIKYLALKQGKDSLNLESTMFHSNYATKLYNYIVLAENEVPVINTRNFATKEMLEEHKHELVFPMILKYSRGSHGDSVHLVESFEEIGSLFSKNSYEISLMLFQEYIQSSDEYKEDYRVITVGSEVVGAYKKRAPRNSIITNLGSGGSSISLDTIPDELMEIGKKVIKAFNAEYTGIDIIYKNSQPLVLEVNRSPQFKGFEKATGINLAGYLIEYALEAMKNSLPSLLLNF